MLLEEKVYFGRYHFFKCTPQKCKYRGCTKANAKYRTSLCQEQKPTFSGKQYTSSTNFKNMGAASEERRTLSPKVKLWLVMSKIKFC